MTEYLILDHRWNLTSGPLTNVKHEPTDEEKEHLKGIY